MENDFRILERVREGSLISIISGFFGNDTLLFMGVIFYLEAVFLVVRTKLLAFLGDY